METADPKQKFLRAGFEPATYGYLTMYNYSPPLYQLSYRRWDGIVGSKLIGIFDWLAVSLRTEWYLTLMCGYTLSHWVSKLMEGDVAQMVERSLSMWEVGGSIPPVSKNFFTEKETKEGPFQMLG